PTVAATRARVRMLGYAAVAGAVASAAAIEQVLDLQNKAATSGFHDDRFPSISLLKSLSNSFALPCRDQRLPGAEQAHLYRVLVHAHDLAHLVHGVTLNFLQNQQRAIGALESFQQLSRQVLHFDLPIEAC